MRAATALELVASSTIVSYSPGPHVVYIEIRVFHVPPLRPSRRVTSSVGCLFHSRRILVLTSVQMKAVHRARRLARRQRRSGEI